MILNYISEIPEKMAYTGKGDQGTTCLSEKGRIDKDDVRLEAIGDIDMVESYLGKIRAHWRSVSLTENGSKVAFKPENTLIQIQSILKCLNSRISSHVDTNLSEDISEKSEKIKSVKDAHEIDRIISELSDLSDKCNFVNNLLERTLSDFIYPGSSNEEADHHVCRCLTRKAERSLIRSNVMVRNNPYIAYMNRLSSFCFVLGRYWAQIHGESEITRYEV